VRGATEASPAELPANMRLTQTYGDTAEASKLFAWEGRVLHERAVPVHHGGRIVGHVVEIRLVSQAPNAVRQVQRLIGKEAALAVGNLDGSLWTDLNRVIDHPAPSDTLLYVRSGRTWVGASARLPGGPWIVSTELPQDAVLASVFALRWRLVAIGAAIVVLAAIVAAWLSRWLTTPLARLTAAAEGIAEGDRTVHRLATHRSDEIGRLARAFAVMAENVHASRDTLEHRIGERTSELTVALERLRATQEELLRKERFATLGHVSSSIAHELRNPLGVMTNVLYYLEAVLADAPPKVREYLAKLQVQVRLSESIITGLLEVTRTNAANPAAVSVHALVEEQIQRAAIPTTIRVESNVPSDLPEVWVDRVQIGQVLFNLLTNAMQAMAGAPGVLSLSARTDGDHVRIDVADTGPGIPTDHLAKIFEPLFTTKARGIGLGLSVSRALASANRAMLTASNRPEGGALLSLEVPTLASVAAAGAEGRHPTAEVSGPNASTAIMART